MSMNNLTTKDIKRLLRSGQYAWPGGYPMFFITIDGAALSFESVCENWPLVCDSVRHDSDDGWRVIAADINWEDPNLRCEDTGELIEWAYGE